MLRRFGILAIACQLALVQLVQAAEEHGEAAGGHEASPSLFSGDLGNAIWTLVIFFILLGVLGKFAWKPILSALQSREKFIRESLEAAKRDRELAETKLKEYEQRIAKAAQEATTLVEEGRRDGEMLKRKIEEEAQASAQATIDRAKREISLAKDSALKELYDTSAKLGTAIAGNLLKRQITPEDQRKLVEDALSELSTA